MRNPGVSDYSMLLFQKRIIATGSIKDEAKLLSQPSKFNIDYWRYRIINAIRQAIGDQPSMGIIIGLAVGERQWISQQQRQVLAKTGTAHLIAISGLHVGLIAALAILLARNIAISRILVLTLFAAIVKRVKIGK